MTEADAPAIAALMTVEVSQWLASWPAPCTPDDAVRKIRLLTLAAARRHAFPLTIMDRDGRTVMGMVSVVRSDHDRSRGELSYWLGRAFHGRGYMREAVSAALTRAFDHLAVTVIEAGAQPANAASFAIMHALGFQPIADRMVFAQSRDREESCHYYELRRGGGRGGEI